MALFGHRNLICKGYCYTSNNYCFYLNVFAFIFDDRIDQDKDNDSRNHQATQAVIQRRKRPKRRSTGVVHVDLDEIDPDRQDTSSCGGTDDSIGGDVS